MYIIQGVVYMILNKIYLIYDNILDITSSIRVAKDKSNIRIIIDNKLDNGIYYQFKEIIKGVYLLVDGNNNRKIIDSNGDTLESWKCDNSRDTDIYHIGKYLDSLDNVTLQNSINDNNNLIDIKIDKEYKDYIKYELEIEKQQRYIDDLKVISLKDTKTNKEFYRTIGNKGLDIKFIYGNIDDNDISVTTYISIIDKYLRYIRRYGFLNNKNTDLCGIYDNNNNLILKCKLYSIFNMTRIRNGLIIPIEDSKRYKIIYKGKLKDREYEYLGKVLNKLKFREINTGKIERYKKE